MPALKPKKLTSRQALQTVKQPLRRWGDLVVVQIHNELQNASTTDFPNGEMRSTFLPNLPDLKGKFDHNFKQPETNEHIKKLYESAGWIESLEHFSDVALALYFKYRGGMFSGKRWAGTVGDGAQFDIDCEEAAKLTPNLRREGVEIIRKTTLINHEKHLLPAIQGKPFADRKKQKGEGVSPIRKAIAKLLTTTPAIKNPELWKMFTAKLPRDWKAFDNRQGKYLEGKTAKEHMTYARFCTVCGEERKKNKPKITG